MVLMTAAHISPNVFSPRNSLSNIQVLFLKIHSSSSIRIMHQIHTNNYLFYLHDILLFYFFGSSLQAGCSRSILSVTILLFSRISYPAEICLEGFDTHRNFLVGFCAQQKSAKISLIPWKLVPDAVNFGSGHMGQPLYKYTVLYKWARPSVIRWAPLCA